MPTKPGTHKPQPRVTARHHTGDDQSWRKGKTTAQQGYGSRWQTKRARYLRAHPLCVACEAAGRLREATEVDHIKPHKGDMDLFWDETNWQSLCKTHHSQKTAEENGFAGPLTPWGVGKR